MSRLTNVSPQRSPQARRGPDAPPPPERSLGSLIVDAFLDLKESVSLLAAGSLFLHQKHKAQQLEQDVPPLTDVPNVALRRPLVVCPGWNTERHKFDFLTHKLLASGQNGEGAVYLKEGHAFQDADCSLPLDTIPSNSKVFVNIWDERNSPPEKTTPQLRANLALLHSAVGPGKVDLVGYSMGGLLSRKYLDEGGTDIGNYMMLGTPNQGTRFGQMSARVINRDIGWALKFSGLTGLDAAAMSWLAAGNPKLADLNSRIPEQMARVDRALIVGGRIEMTPATGLVPFKRGDGMVEGSRLTLPGVETHYLSGNGLLQHGTLPHASQVFREMEQLFGFTEVAGDYVAPVVPPPSLEDTPYGDM